MRKGASGDFSRRGLIAIAGGLALSGNALAQAASPQALLGRRLRCRFADQVFTYTLFDNATTRDLLSLLPLSLSIRDFSNNEKIAHLPRRLNDTALSPLDDETAGDLCYFIGWANLAFFYADYRFANDLIRLGRIDGGVQPLKVRGEYPLQLDILG